MVARICFGGFSSRRIPLYVGFGSPMWGPVASSGYRARPFVGGCRAAPCVSRCGFSPWWAVLALYSLPHAMTKTAHVRRSFQRWGSSAERPQAMRRAIPFRAARLNADVGSTCETNEVGCDGLPPSSGETSGCLSGGAACRVAGGRCQPGWYREGLSLVLGSEGERECARLPGRDGKPFFIGGAPFGPGGALDTRGEGDYGDHGRARATA